MRKLTYAQAISEALTQSMQKDPQVFIFGLGVDDFKGIFNTTKDAFMRFGKNRVFDTPASEGALTGIAIGAALNGKRPVLVHARNDFMFLALDQMINNAAKWKYISCGASSVPFVVRSIIGKGWGQGPIHSQNLAAVLAHFPGLYVAMPSNPYDMKGILMKSLQLDCPVAVLEHRALYSSESDVPQEPYTVEFGQAKVLREGRDVTVVATSFMVSEALKAAVMLESAGINIEIVDPISLQPLDEETILKSVRKTGHLVCADCDWGSCGFSAEVAAVVAEKAFAQLKGPIRRVVWPPSPCPVSRVLEEAFYPTALDIAATVYTALGRKVTGSLQRKKEADSFVGPY